MRCRRFGGARPRRPRVPYAARLPVSFRAMLHAPLAQPSPSVVEFDPPVVLTAPASQSRRLPAIDAARGAAMVLVCLSHFAAKYIAPAGGDLPGGWLRFVGHIASPMFFIISGAMVGYLFAIRPGTFDAVRDKLARRALFFLTIGHLLILGAHVQHIADFAQTARILFVTDTIALALLVSPRLLAIRPSVRLAGALVTYIVSCAVVFLWYPDSLALRIIKDTLVGPDGPSFWSYNVPIVPWLAVHAAGTVLGGLLARSASKGHSRAVETQLVSAGCILAAAAAAVRIVCWFLIGHVFTPRGEAARAARQLASPWYRLPPSPAHLLLFSGVALLAIAAVFAIERLGIFTKVIAWLAVLGKTSAFVFVFQFYVFYVFIPKWIPLHLALSPIIFAGAMMIIGQAARMWMHRNTWLARSAWFMHEPSVVRGGKQ